MSDRLPIRIKLLLISLALFIFLLPVALQIDFLQNDEWVHYSILNRFLNGNFKLPSVTAPTFYSIGFLAMFWVYLFGVTAVPVLTLLVSVGCFFVLALILVEIYNKDIVISVLLALLLFVNPLFVFTTWGFMTDNYFLFFVLLSIYFLFGYTKNYKFVLGNIFVILAYFARQLGLVTPLAFGIYLFLKKDYKKALLQMGVFVLLACYHFMFFPKTNEMLETKFEYSNFWYFRLVFSFLFIVGIYLVAFLLPVVVTHLAALKKSLLIKILGISVILTILGGLYFKPTIGWRNDFPYFIYTYQQNGFFKENLHGKKPVFMFNNDIHRGIDFIARICLVALVIKILLKNRKQLDFPLFYLIIYLALLLISAKVYDRYLIPVVAVFILFLAKDLQPTRYTRYLLGTFVLLMGLYSYNFEADYFLTNKYVWNKAKEIVQIDQVNENRIIATDAWRYLYSRSNAIYKFTYDTPSKGDYGKLYTVLDIKDIKYPLSFWGTTKIYLYKLNSQEAQN